MLSVSEVPFSEIAMITGAIQVLPPHHGALLFRGVKNTGNKGAGHFGLPLFLTTGLVRSCVE